MTSERRPFTVHAPLFAPLLGAALVAVVGLPLAALLNIWIDEAFTLHTTGGGIAYAWDQSRVFELQPPLYFIFIASLRLLDEASVLLARIPSVVFAAAATGFIIELTRRAAPRLPSVPMAILTALNPIVIWAAVEMRPYALILLVSAVTTLMFEDGFLAAVRSRPAQIWYVVAAVIGLYTQYYVGFILLAQGITLVVVRRSALRSYLGAAAAIAILFAPFLPIVVEQIHAGDAGDVRPVSFVHALHSIGNAAYSYALPHDVGWTGAVKYAGFAISALLLGALLFIGRPRIARQQRWIGLYWGVVCLTFSAVFALSGEAVDVRRHAVSIVPITLMGAYALLSSLRRSVATLVMLSGAIYVIFAAGTYHWLFNWPLSKTGDWRAVAAAVTHGADAVPVAVFPSNGVLALERYMPVSQLIPVPGPMPFSARYLSAMTLSSQTQVSAALKTVAEKRAIWLVSDGSCDSGEPPLYDFHCPFIEDYFSGHYRLARHLRFHGADAKLFVESSARGPTPRVETETRKPF